MHELSGCNGQSLTDQLTIDQVAALLGINVADLQEQTRHGQLVAVAFGSPAGETRYPAFQFVAELREPVQQCLQLLGPVEAYLYLSSVHPDMAGLTPLEVLWGRRLNDRKLADEASEILGLGADERLRLVLGWARTQMGQTARW